MNFARIARAAVVVTAGALATAGAASAAPALNLGADTGHPAATTDATPVHHYGSYHQGYYNNYYQPYYQPYGYAPYGYAPPPRRRYYAPYGYRSHGYYGYRRPHTGLYIRTPGLRLGIGF